MRPEKQALIDYLKSKTSGSLVMTPDELALEIRVSAKQQSKLRKESRFPIPYREAGRRVHYSLYAVADYLLEGAIPVEATTTSATPSPQEQLPSAATKPIRKPRSQPEDMSQLFMLRSLVAVLGEQKTNIDFLHDYFTRYVNAATFAEKMEAELGEKDDKVVMRAPWQQ